MNRFVVSYDAPVRRTEGCSIDFILGSEDYQSLFKIHTRSHALQRHNTENSKQIFPEKELRGHSSNSYIHVSVGDLYIPTIDLPILLQENRWTDGGNI
jgi:hypothetical protein